MASQGLFTQGITVDDLLKQRRVRSQANQQQMMNDAAQGARDPQRARMGSMFGSIIGKALGDNVGGADSEMEKLKASNAQKQQFQGSYGELMSSGTPEQLKQGAQAFYKAGYITEAGDLNNAANVGAKNQEEKERREIEEAQAEQEAERVKQQQKLLSRKAQELGLPNVAESILVGDKDAIEYLYATMRDIKKKKDTAPEGDVPTADEQNYDRFVSEKKKFDALLEAGELTKAQHAIKVNTARTGLTGVIDYAGKETAISEVAETSALRTKNNIAYGETTTALASIDQSLAILQSGLDTGFGTEFGMEMKKVLAEMGMPVDELRIADSEQFRVNGMKFVMEYIQNTKGAISEAEMKLFAAASPTLSTSVAGNNLLLTTARTVKDWERRKAAYMDNWYNDARLDEGVVRPSAWNKTEREWEANNKLSLPTAADIDAIINGTTSVDTSGVPSASSELESLMLKYTKTVAE